ncbi:hypothetical protein BJV74DRAFT_889830 [Russula compacta]|nr:hypothetical protein BJV74DRAFT_889830 [Russula compacta]
MFPAEYKAWYGPDHKRARKGYPGLPAWLPDDLFTHFGPLPHNPENVWPKDPAGVPTMDTQNEEGLSPQHATQAVFAEIWPLTTAPSTSANVPETGVAPLPAPAPSTSPDPIPIPPPQRPIVVAREEAIDLTNSDEDDT